MKKSLILTSLIIINPIFADSFLVKLDKKNYENRLNVVSETIEPEHPTDPEEPEVLYTSCLDVMQKGGSTGDGMYTITNNGDITSHFCEMTSHGGGWTRIERSQLSNFSYSEIMSSDKNILSSEQMNRFSYLMNNNIALYRWTLNVPTLLAPTNGSLIQQNTFHDIPNVPFSMPIRITADGWTRASDADQGRIYIAAVQTEDNISQRLIADSGYRDWSANGVNILYNSTINPEDIRIRLYGACKRNTGTQCSASITNVNVIINYDLPANYDIFYVR